MPIRKQFLKFYGKKWKEEIRPRILRRARNRCEQCKKPNRRLVFTRTDGTRMYWQPLTAGPGRWTDQNGKLTNLYSIRPTRKVRVVLTVAHLDHTPGHDDDDNLKALCQWCHLNYDKLHHAETRATRKDAGRPLLALLTFAESKHA